MREQELTEHHSRITHAVEELEALIRERFPSATFVVSRGEDPDGIYLDAIVDLDDPDVVMDLVVDRLLTLQVDEGLPVHVVPLRTPERVTAALHAARAQNRPPVVLPLQP